MLFTEERISPSTEGENRTIQAQGWAWKDHTVRSLAEDEQMELPEGNWNGELWGVSDKVPF